MPNSLCSGASAISAIAVVQLGLATIFFFDFVAASALISGTTSGMPSLYRKADELSITSAPPSPSAIFSAHSRLKSPETARKTTSQSRAASSVNSSILRSPNGVATSLPADLAEANSLSSDTGNLRFPSTSMISLPTAPVTPTTPTLSGLSELSILYSCADLRRISRNCDTGCAARFTAGLMALAARECSRLAAGPLAPALNASAPPRQLMNRKDLIAR